MQDQQVKTTNNQNSDTFYEEVENIGVSEDTLKTMAAITAAQTEAADNTDEILKEMNQVIAEEKSEDN